MKNKTLQVAIVAQNKKQATHLHCLFVKVAVNSFLFSHMHHFFKKKFKLQGLLEW